MQRVWRILGLRWLAQEKVHVPSGLSHSTKSLSSSPFAWSREAIASHFPRCVGQCPRLCPYPILVTWDTKMARKNIGICRILFEFLFKNVTYLF